MFKESISEIPNRIKCIISNVIKIKPIGNHELERHLVYLVETLDSKYVIKFYYVQNRWNREVAALRLLQNSDVLVPNIVDYGKIDDVEWIVYEYVEGTLLDKVHKEIPINNLKDIYHNAGEQLGMIHSFKQFKYFGSLNEDIEFINEFKTFKGYFETEVQRIFTNLDNFTHKEIKLIIKAKKSLNDYLKKLDKTVVKARLCHNDFGARNLIVSKENGVYKLKCVIDFEQSVISDVDRELVMSYQKLLEENKILGEAFKLGYEEYLIIDEDKISHKEFIYKLYRGLDICSWSQKVDKNHYDEGIKILKKTLAASANDFV